MTRDPISRRDIDVNRLREHGRLQAVRQREKPSHHHRRLRRELVH